MEQLTCPSPFRTNRTIDAESVDYAWDQAAGLPQMLQDGDGNTYVYGLDLISVTDVGDDTVYFLCDGLGSTTGLTDEAGDPVADYQYDVFGAVRDHTGASTEFTYTGEQNDPTALEYLRARYYDPATGRFLGRDPLPLLQGYSYVGNNPVNMVDPSGLIGLPIIDLPDIPSPGDIADYVGDKAQDTAGLLGQCWNHPGSCGSDTAAYLLSLTCHGDRQSGPGGWTYYQNVRGGCAFMFGISDATCYTPGYITFCSGEPGIRLRCHEYQHYIQSRLIPSGLYWIVATLPFAGERDADAAFDNKESRVPFTPIPWSIQCN